jgi:LAO/AO transport system kinase
MNIKAGNDEPKHLWLLTEKAWHLIQNRKMQGISKTLIEADIKEKKSLNMTFNLYQYIEKWL